METVDTTIRPMEVEGGSLPISEEADTPAPAEAWRFWTAAQAEARATWWGRCRGLWLTAAIGIFFLMARGPDLDHAGGMALLGLVCWVPAWLCGDLLVRRYRDDPEQFAGWQPARFLARAVGRLGPFLGVLAAWSILMVSLNMEGLGGTNWRSRPELAPFFWTGWIALFLAFALFYAAGAALLSALTRRSQRYVIAPLMVIFGSLAVTLLVSLMRGSAPSAAMSLSPERPNWLYLVIAPSLQVAAAAFEVVETWFGTEWEMRQLLSAWSVTGLLVLAALAFSLLSWWIAACRYRREGRRTAS